MRADRSISMSVTVRQRKWWATLAIVALAFLSLRPACEVWLSHAKEHAIGLRAAVHAARAHEAPVHEPHDTACCASIEGAALVKPADMLLPRIAQNPPAAPLSVQSALWIAVPLLHALTASVIPPGNPPFHVRSARILR